MGLRRGGTPSPAFCGMSAVVGGKRYAASISRPLTESSEATKKVKKEALLEKKKREAKDRCRAKIAALARARRSDCTIAVNNLVEDLIAKGPPTHVLEKIEALQRQFITGEN